MKNSGVIIIVVILVAAAASFYFMNSKSGTPAPEEVITEEETMTTEDTQAMEKVIQLTEQNESSESGVAILTEAEGKVVVTLNMAGAPATTPQPAHIHAGSCPDVGAVVYPLTNVVNGVSVTTLDATLADLTAKQPLGINVHKSAAESKVYVSCGDVAL